MNLEADRLGLLDFISQEVAENQKNYISDFIHVSNYTKYQQNGTVLF